MICPHITNSLYIENDGYVYPCFNTANKLTNAIVHHNGVRVHASALDPDAILNWDSIVEMRQKLDNGKWPIACSKCRILEDKGLVSSRTNLPITTIIPKLEIIHLRLGNKCNLRCVMCGPNASNQWYDDYVDITGTTTFKVANDEYELVKDKNNYRLKSDNFNFSENEKLADIIVAKSKDLKEIHFHGGEPLLSKSHNTLIQLLIEKNLSCNISLFYHTNATIYNQNIFSKLKEFKNVTFMLSLDGVGAINDAIRWPSKWDNILNVIDKMRDFNISVNHTLHMLNAEHLPYFLNEMQAFNFQTKVSIVTEPGYMSLGGLLDNYQIDRLIKNSINCSEHIVKATSIPTNTSQLKINRERFIKLWQSFSLKQNQDWDNLFPLALTSMKEWQIS